MTVAALYTDPQGPYPTLADVDAWDARRDAREYKGPYPVVAHPPCGPWGSLRTMCRYQDADLALRAVEQVRAWGGVLEHPRGSGLWKAVGLPLPGAGPDVFGGWALSVEQVAWGHCCRKPTWLYCVGVDQRLALETVRKGGHPTHMIASRARRGGLLAPSAKQRRVTPRAFAEWLVLLANSVRREVADAA